MVIPLEGGASVSSITNLIKENLPDNAGEFWFRGQPDYEHKLIPALFREQYDEAGMYGEFIRRFPEHSNNHRDIFEWLTLMQHYGLPTRLLDWTTNLRVALFFCCNDEKDKDGAIFVFKPHSQTIVTSASSPASFFDKLFELLTRSKSKEDFYIRFKPVMYEIQQSSRINFDLDNIEDDIFPIPSFFTYYPYKPPHKNPRIIKQHGCFTFHDGKFFDGKEFIPMSKIEEKEGLFKITIAANYKKSLLEELKLLGITEATLFPEMEYQAKQIKELYKYK